MTEEETVKAAYEIIVEGALSRRNGTTNNYRANTLRHFLSAQGWLVEDLRIALMKANPTYEKGQAAFGQGLESLP
jgi:hypothetical protein